MSQNKSEIKANAMAVYTAQLHKPTGRTRVWVASKRLNSCFGEVGAMVNVEYDTQKKTITLSEAELMGEHKVSYRTEKNGTLTPIIDLKNSLVSEIFEPEQKLQVTFYSGKVVIKQVEADVQADKRLENAKNKTVFELFASAGGLTNQFKSAGYRSLGGLEMNEDALECFIDNQGEQTFSVMSALEYVNAEEIVRNLDGGITTLLAGIPCQNYSVGNTSMNKAMKGLREGSGADEKMIARKTASEFVLPYFVLKFIQAACPAQVCIEEVPGFENSNARWMIEAVLSAMGYTINTSICTGSMTMRKRFVMTASIFAEINLDNLAPSAGKTIADCLDGPIESRDWRHYKEMPRIKRIVESEEISKAIGGVRYHYPHETTVRTWSTHLTRGTEPCLRNPANPDEYSEFSATEKLRIQGLDLKLSGQKTLDHRNIGMSVSDAFKDVAKRMMKNLDQGLNGLAGRFAEASNQSDIRKVA